MLDWLESTSLALWLRESPSLWSTATVMTLHTMGMAILVGASWVLDLRLLGVSRNVPVSAFRWVFPAVAVGLTMNLITGVLLFIKNATVWATAIPFLVKMALVVASAATIIPIRKYVVNSDAGTLAVGSDARLLAVASILAWTGAVVAGRMLAYLVV
jgi:hypothetical protein